MSLKLAYPLLHIFPLLFNSSTIPSGQEIILWGKKGGKKKGDKKETGYLCLQK